MGVGRAHVRAELLVEGLRVLPQAKLLVDHDAAVVQAHGLGALVEVGRDGHAALDQEALHHLPPHAHGVSEGSVTVKNGTGDGHASPFLSDLAALTCLAESMLTPRGGCASGLVWVRYPLFERLRRADAPGHAFCTEDTDGSL